MASRAPISAPEEEEMHHIILCISHLNIGVLAQSQKLREKCGSGKFSSEGAQAGALPGRLAHSMPYSRHLCGHRARQSAKRSLRNIRACRAYAVIWKAFIAFRPPSPREHEMQRAVLIEAMDQAGASIARGIAELAFSISPKIIIAQSPVDAAGLYLARRKAKERNVN